MKSSADKINLSTFDSLFGGGEEPDAGTPVEIPLEDLHPFRGHPFHVIEDEKMMELAESIRERGVLSPGIVRHRKEGGFEIIAGHRRRHGCKLAGLPTMPVIIRELGDDEAVIIMVDSNLQREEILPSEKAFAYKMKLEAMRHQGARLDLTCSQPGNRFPGKKSSEIMAEQTGDSKNQIFRYIRLTELLPRLLDLVDKRKIAFIPAEKLSFLTKEQQQWLSDFICEHGVYPSLSQAEQMKQYSQENKLSSRDVIEVIMSVEKPASIKITMKRKDVEKYFPREYTAQEMQTVILRLLEQWKESGEKGGPAGQANMFPTWEHVGTEQAAGSSFRESGPRPVPGS